MGFCKALLSRVENLQIEHFNGGEHKPFLFKTEKEKARLYSIMWEYIGEPAERGRNEGKFRIGICVINN